MLVLTSSQLEEGDGGWSPTISGPLGSSLEGHIDIIFLSQKLPNLDIDRMIGNQYFSVLPRSKFIQYIL